MTKEQNFKVIIDIAVENGFKVTYDKHIELRILSNYVIGLVQPICSVTGSININDLVLNTNFFACLFKDFHFSGVSGTIYLTANDYTHWLGEDSDSGDFELSSIQFMKFQWVLKIEKGVNTNNPDLALNWLFEQFNL